MHHYQSILVAVDFSDSSDKALARAVQLASFYKASIKVVHVMELPTYPVLEDVAVMGLPGVWDPELTEQIQKVSVERLNKLLTESGLNESHGKLLIGAASNEILEYAHQMSAELIVMGRHGSSGWKSLLGSTTDTVLHQASCDVLAINLEK
ncbi:MAG: universal stress protein [Pseudomonadota bacterium]|nr:universal stress protein [Pseudomonadota bacterium]